MHHTLIVSIADVIVQYIMSQKKVIIDLHSTLSWMQSMLSAPWMTDYSVFDTKNLPIKWWKSVFILLQEISASISDKLRFILISSSNDRMGKVTFLYVRLWKVYLCSLINPGRAGLNLLRFCRDFQQGVIQNKGLVT